MKRRTRMYEPWGYRDENNYESSEIIRENDLESFFSDVNYNKDDNKIHFQNKDGEEVASLDVNEFVKSDSIIDHTEYKDGILSIYFTNGDVVNIDLTELIDENEFKDGFVVNDHVVKVLIDGESDDYLSVSENGVKVAGVKADIETEEARATSAETALDEKIDAEIARATSAETALDTKIDDEIARAKEAEQALDEKISVENGRAEAAEANLSRRADTLNDELDAEKTIRESEDAKLDRKIDQEITDRKADVDEEEARAKAAEEALQGAIDAEAARATSAETALQAAIETEGQRAQNAEAALDEKIDAEEARALSAETELAEGIEILGSIKFDEVVYDSSAKTITFYAEGNRKGEIDTTDFVKDGMISDVKIEGGNLVITFNTDSGKENINIPLTDIFNPDNYYDKDAINGIVSGISEEISNETATRAENDETLSQSIEGEKTRAEAKETALQASIETEAATARAAEQANAEAIVAEKDRAEAAEALKANSADVDTALALKADKSEIPTDFYTKEEVDELLAAKDAEIEEIQAAYDRLNDMVLDLYYATTYSIPADSTLDTMLKSKSGEAKLTEDITTGTITAGVTAKNIVKLNLGGKTVTFTGSSTSSPAMMFRNKQQVNIGGSGTIDAGGRVAVEADGADCVVTLSGTMFGRPTYTTDRSGGELIYCYLGTINITDGIFKNTGEDKKFLLNCYDANYKNGTAKIVVTGGKFYDFNPADNSAEGEHTNFVAEGYHVEISQDGDSTVYTVKKDA